jgi:hypothetical protein
MKRVTKKERQLYDLLEQVRGLLSDPESYGMRSYYAMVGTEARYELIKRLDAAIQPYEEWLEQQRQAEEEYND